MAVKVGGELYKSITGQLFEIARQLRQPNGYPFDPESLQKHLQAAIEGRFGGGIKSSLLELVGSIAVPATAEKFVAHKRFVVDTNDKAGVKIAWLGVNFKEWFLGKTEEAIGESELRYHKLLKSSLDAPIIATLGGEEKVEIALAQMFSLLEKQGDSEQGVFLTNGYANIFYIRDINGVLRAVHAYWYGDGWYASACSVGHPGRWDDGYQVFSPQF